MQHRGVADYMYVLEVHTTFSIKDLVDLSADGAKEALAERLCGIGANCFFPATITAMVRYLRQEGFNGWYSLQNMGDDRFEVCLFHLPQAWSLTGVTLLGLLCLETICHH